MIRLLVHEQRRVVLLVAVALAGLGAMQWLTMPREEDPRLPDRFASIVVPWPGAAAADVEREIIMPLEDALAAVPEVDTVESEARANVAVITVSVSEIAPDPGAALDRIEEIVADQERSFPAGTLAADVDTDLMDVQSVLIALTGGADAVELRRSAEHLERQLLGVSSVERVERIGDPAEEVRVELDEYQARSIGLPPEALIGQLQARFGRAPSGAIEDAARNLVVDTAGPGETLDDLRELPVHASNGVVRLSDIAHIEHGTVEPAETHVRHQGQPAVLLGVVPRPGLDAVRFGQKVLEVTDAFAAQGGDVDVEVVAFQPAYVAQRLSGLGWSLVQGIAIVAAVLILGMGIRVGLIVSMVVPLVTLASLAIYALGGGVLHQISIAGFVLALGLLVDNAIVVAEAVQTRIDAGQRRDEAAIETARELAAPLFSATGTTVASFLPLYLAAGDTGAFTRAIPITVVITLVVSLVFAVTVTPVLAAFLFRPSTSSGRPPGRLTVWLSRFGVRSPWTILGVAGVLVALGLARAGDVRQQFFPAADRNQAIVEVVLPEGASLQRTDAAASTIERMLLAQPGVSAVSTFVGRAAPRFYYNLLDRPAAPHVAQILVTADHPDDVVPVLEVVRAHARAELGGVTVVARRLEQGPPVAAPVEYRLFGDDLDALWDAANAIATQLRQTPGTVDVRHSLSPGGPRAELETIDAIAPRFGVDRAAIARALFVRTRGLHAGSLRLEGEDTPVPIVVRTPDGVYRPTESLERVDVWTAGGPVPAVAVAELGLGFGPVAVQRRDRTRTVTVSSQLVSGASFNEVVGSSRAAVEAIAAAHHVRLELGGDAEGSGEASGAIAVAGPLGALMLIGFLLWEFRSVRRTLLVLTTVPLAAAGVVPGLLIFDQPFGFTALLGTIALIGIVVNNAIILIDAFEVELRGGRALDDAISAAVRTRMRPILLTTITTVGGLVPLLVSSSTLWPPLAAAMIAGLAASTVLTLFVVPAAYWLVFKPRAGHSDPRAARGVLVPAVVVLVGLAAGAATMAPRAAHAQSVTWELVANGAVAGPGEATAQAQVRAARWSERAARRQGFAPTLTTAASWVARSDELITPTPIGDVVQTEQTTLEAAIVLQQPLVDVGAQVADLQVATAQRAVAAAQLEATERSAVRDALLAYVDVLDVRAAMRVAETAVVALQSQRDRVVALQSLDRALPVDVQRVEVALAQADERRAALSRAESVALSALARALGVSSLSDVQAHTFEPADLEAVAADTEFVGHPELLALERQADVMARERRALQADSLPVVSLDGRWVFTDSELLEPNNWGQVGLTLRWTPVAGLARAAGAHALQSSEAAIDSARQDASSGLALAREVARAALSDARGAFDVAERAHAQSVVTRDVTVELHSAGRVSFTDVLLAETAVAESELASQQARHDAARAWVQLAWAAGAPFTATGRPVDDAVR